MRWWVCIASELVRERDEAKREVAGWENGSNSWRRST